MTPAKAPREKPTHVLSVIEREASVTARGGRRAKRGAVGAGWLEKDGSITLVLNPCVRLTGEHNYTIKLFPVNGAATNSVFGRKLSLEDGPGPDGGLDE
jgi:hypothetical protein